MTTFFIQEKEVLKGCSDNTFNSSFRFKVIVIQEPLYGDLWVLRTWMHTKGDSLKFRGNEYKARLERN